MPQLSQSAINELLGLIAERRAACAKDGKTSAGLESVQVAFESLMAKGQGSNLFWVRPAEQEYVTAPVVPMLSPVSSSGAATSPACHVLIEGDNYHALQLLQHTHRQAVDVIYIDPPYNTNRGDFRYNDTWVDSTNKWKHSLWLSFMEKRLRLAKELLRDDGVVFVSIDDNEQPQLALLLAEIFGESNVGSISVKLSEASGVKMASVIKQGSVAKLKEHVLIARKTGGVRGLFFKPIPKETWDKEYSLYLDGWTEADRAKKIEVEELPEPEMLAALAAWNTQLARCKFRSVGDVLKEKNIPDEDQDAWRRQNAWRIFQVAASSSVQTLVQESPLYQRQQVVALRSKTGLVYLGRGDISTESAKPRVQLLCAEDNLFQQLGDFWSDIKTTGLDAEGGVSFKNGKKPLALITRLIDAVRKPNAVVLDFFAGSGTTAQAVMALNAADKGTRQCILVTNNEVDKETAQKLTKRGITEGSLDWEKAGICQSVTWPRIAGVANGLLAESNQPRVEYFRLTCQPLGLESQEEGVRLYRAADKAEARAKAIMAQSTPLSLFSPIAWLEAGAQGSYDIDEASVGQGCGFVVVHRASELPPALGGLRVVYLLTGTLVEQPGASLSAAAARITSKFPSTQKVTVKELWIDYLKNFPVEDK